MKRIIAVIVIGLFCAVTVMYFSYFHKGSTEDLLAANRLQRGNGIYDTEISANMLRKALASGIDEEEAEIIAYQHYKWDRFIAENNYVDIGSLYDKCGRFNIY